MNGWKDLQRYRYLLFASAVILITTFALVWSQYRSAQKAEAQAQQTLRANLDLHLLGLVDEAKRDMLDHANHIFHSITQRRVRERDVPRLERAFTRAARRYEEVGDFFVVFFDGSAENRIWRVFRFQPPNAADPAVKKYNGALIGNLTEDFAASIALSRAWHSATEQNRTLGEHTITVFAPVDSENAQPQQVFFHIVYESDRLDRQDNLNQVGLLAFTANAENYPSPNFLSGLIQRRATDKTDSLGQLNYTIALHNDQNKTEKLLVGDNQTPPIYTRGFESSDNLFPNLSFGISAPVLPANYTENLTQSSILLGFGAAALSIVGLGLTWRATRREMKVARLKSDFLASISHELKTPLTAIRAFGDLIHSGRAKDSAKIREYGAIIKAESDRLTALINNILEMSRLERGLRLYRLENNSLCGVVSETVEVFRHTSDAQGFQIKVELPPPVSTKFDESAIRQAILNLLSNAVKYSGSQNDNARIDVSLKTAETEAVIEIRDYGIGISAAEQKRIFEAFHRAPENEVQTQRGTGLGLAIVREVARAHGGEVSVESDVGAGSLFRLHLPLLKDS